MFALRQGAVAVNVWFLFSSRGRPTLPVDMPAVAAGALRIVGAFTFVAGAEPPFEGGAAAGPAERLRRFAHAASRCSRS